MHDRILRVAALAVLLVFGTAEAKKPPVCNCECPVIYTFDEPGWIALSTAEISGAYGFHSAPVAGVLTGNGVGEAPLLALPLDQPPVLGRTYVVRAWVNADFADEATPFTLGIGEFLQTVFQASVHRSQVGPGLQLIELGTFTNNSAIDTWLLLLTLESAGPAAGRWVVDDIEIRELSATEALIMARKLDAVNALRDALKTIDGTSGYQTNLGGRVYKAVVTPDDDLSGVELPYGFVKVHPESAIDEDEDTIISQFNVSFHLFVAETWEERTESTAVDFCLRFADDIKLFRLKNPDLSGTVHEFSFLGFNDDDAGVLPSENWIEAVAAFALKQYVDLGSLQS